jgi:RIO-like serine/threonine protein kinase
MGTSDSVEQTWNILERVLELLHDTRWHPVKEIKEETHLHEKKLASILRFLSQFDLINYVAEKSRVKIKPSGLRFLGLPSEFHTG